MFHCPLCRRRFFYRLDIFIQEVGFALAFILPLIWAYAGIWKLIRKFTS